MWKFVILSKMKQIVWIMMLCCFWIGSAQADKPVSTGFTSMERNHVRVQTPGLFAKGNSFEIHLECLADSQFCFPLRNGKVISAYGSRGGHSGTDIKTKANDSIVCVFDGVVRMAKHYGGYGKVIVVRHSNGLETLYSHNSKNFVHSGDTVKAGQVIALTGRSGRATTEHLHFELRVNGQHFSPSLLFNMQTRQPLKRTLVCTKSGKHVKLQPKK